VKVHERAPISAVPPHHLEAEQGVLGSMLLDRDAIAQVVDAVRPQDFYRDAHRVIFETMLDLFERGEPVDLITMTNRLETAGKLEDIGGATYLASLPNVVPTAASIEAYANIVVEKAMLRELMHAGMTITGSAQGGADGVDELLDDAERLVFGIGQRRERQEAKSIREVLRRTFETIDQRHQHPGHVTGLASGFRDLVRLTSGFRPQDMIIVAGRPSMGKSTMAGNIAQYVAIKLHQPVAFFSLETSAEQLVERMLSSAAEVDGAKLRTGFLGDADWRKLASAVGALSEAPITIDDTPGLSLLELRAKTRRIKAEHGLALVIVDYVQLMQSARRVETRTQELGEIARGLKALAKELDVPMIVVSQLSRAVEAMGQKRPMLSHLRDSGELEQTADQVIFLHRDDYYDPEQARRDGTDRLIEFVLAKNRSGQVGTVRAFYLKHVSTMRDLDEQHAAAEAARGDDSSE